jgi:hypothetical protein
VRVAFGDGNPKATTFEQARRTMLRLPYPTRRGNQPGYKGVRKIRDKFIAQVHRKGKRYHLGTYPTEQHAALAVNQALGLLFQDLPARFMNDLPLEDMPTPEDQEGILLEVRLRLGLADPLRSPCLANA